jgi:4-hydroxybenzoate polyprenyltransferase
MLLLLVPRAIGLHRPHELTWAETAKWKRDVPVVMSKENEDSRRSVLRMFYDVLMVTSAQFWIVAAAPFYIGWFISTRQVWPDGNAILGLLIVGPMIAGSTLAYNAYTDVRVDIFNPRKAHLAYVTGWISPEVVLNLTRGLVILGLLLSTLLGVEFLAIISLCVLLSFLYSNPRTKLKSLAGGDVLVNMVGLGILVPLGGWAAAGSSLIDFPHWYILPIFFALGSLYIPTLVPDVKADRKAGFKTLAVTMGPGAVIWLGFLLLVASVVINFVSGLLDYVLFPELVYRVWPIYIAQVALYAYFGRDTSYRGMLATISTQCIGHGVGVSFMMYALGGWWTIA